MQININMITLFIVLTATSTMAAPLPLRDCLDQAKAGSKSLRTAAFDERIAEENIRTARSGYLPRIDFQGGYVAQLEPQAVKFGVGSPVETQQSDYGFFNFSIQETLYDFGRTASRKEQASLLRDATRHSYGGNQQDLFLLVVRTYYGILDAKRNLSAAEDEVLQMKNHLAVARSLFEQGVVTRNDLLQAEVRLASAQQKRFTHSTAVENSWLQLNYLTGQAPSRRGELQEDGGIDPFTRTDGTPPRSLAARDEIQALRKTIEAGEMAIKESKSSYYPELFARLSVDYVQNDKVREQAIMAATVGLKINLFDGFATTSRLQQAVNYRSREEERLRDLEAKTALELETAGNDLKVAVARIALTESAIRQAEENLRINRDKYQEQVGTATGVIDAQALLTQTRTDYFKALFDFQVAAARIKRATGEL